MQTHDDQQNITRYLNNTDEPITIKDDTDWLSKFYIVIGSSSNKVYANGRQQIELRIHIEARDGETITDEQIDSIHLATVIDGKLAPLKGDLTERLRKNTYSYFEHPGSGVNPNNSGLPTFFVTRYVCSTRPGGSTDTIYAAIFKDDATVYVSETPSFQSSVTFESITPLRASREDFAFWAEDVSTVTSGYDTWDYDLWHLKSRRPDIQIIKSYPLDYDGEEETNGPDPYYIKVIDISWLPWLLGQQRTRGWAHYAFKVGGPRKSLFSGEIEINKLKNVMNFVRVRWETNDSRAAPGTTNPPNRWKLIDKNGSAHYIEMTQESDGNLINFNIYEPEQP